MNPTFIPHPVVPQIEEPVPSRLHGPERQSFVRPGLQTNLDECDQIVLAIYGLTSARELERAEAEICVVENGVNDPVQTEFVQDTMDAVVNNEDSDTNTEAENECNQVEQTVKLLISDLTDLVSHNVVANEVSTTEKNTVVINQIGGGNKGRVCPYCKHTITTPLTDHCKAVHGKNRFFCLQCPKSYSRERDLAKHVKTAHTKKNYVSCKHCLRFFQLQTELDRHIMTRHSTPETKSQRLKMNPESSIQIH